MIEIGPSATSWKIDNVTYYMNGASITVTNGNIKHGGYYFGGNASGESPTGQGNWQTNYLLSRYTCKQ
jgi:hypothetical protein